MAGHIPTPLARGLPRPIAERLGRLVVRCTHVEYYLLLVTKRLLGISISHARDLFSDGSWKTRFERLERLAEAKKFQVVVPHGFKGLLEQTEVRRNLLVHASWRFDGTNFSVHKARNQHARAPEEVIVDKAYLDATGRMLNDCLDVLRGLDTQTGVLLSAGP